MRAVVARPGEKFSAPPVMPIVCCCTRQVSVVKWNKNGNFFLSASRDQHQKLWDLRAMDEPIRDYAGQNAGICSIAWHPVHENMWVSGGLDGSVRADRPRASCAR